jgi:hypothetical protein
MYIPYIVLYGASIYAMKCADNNKVVLTRLDSIQDGVCPQPVPLDDEASIEQGESLQTVLKDGYK